MVKNSIMSRLSDAYGSRWEAAQVPPPLFGNRAIPTQAVPVYYNLGGGVGDGCAAAQCTTPAPSVVPWEMALPDSAIPRDAYGNTNLPSHVAFSNTPPPGQHAGNVGAGVMGIHGFLRF